MNLNLKSSFNGKKKTNCFVGKLLGDVIYYNLCNFSIILSWITQLKLFVLMLKKIIK